MPKQNSVPYVLFMYNCVLKRIPKTACMKFSQFRQIAILLPICLFTMAILFSCEQPGQTKIPLVALPVFDSTWVAPDINTDSSISPHAKQIILYGAELIAHTAKYFGPQGSITHTSNGMNCQNCHIDAGRKSWGNNFGAVAAIYPRFNGRSGSAQTIYGRINDCFQRSLNGKALDTTTKEMQAMFAYLDWVGKKVPKGKKPIGSGVEKIPFINRAASPDSGRLLYAAKCVVCHGRNGEGLLAAGGLEYSYPPLWGPHSYNNGAGLYRLGSFAGFIKSNMPYLQATHKAPVLTTEQAWDIAAFVNSQPRPEYNQQKDWKNIKLKPVDYPFGPYADSFTQQQHKYGPFKPIAAVATAKK